MSQKALFDKLGVPLKSIRWSWGGVRADETDETVLLKVWEDEKCKIPDGGNREFVRVTDKNRFESRDRKRKHPGYYERLEHLARIKNGAKSYMVICVAKDVHAIPRKVNSFNSDELYIGGRLMDYNGNYWLEIVGRVLVQDFLLSRQ